MLVVIAVEIALFGAAFISFKVVEIKHLSWMRETWTPYLNNLANHANPTHERLPGDM